MLARSCDQTWREGHLLLHQGRELSLAELLIIQAIFTLAFLFGRPLISRLLRPVMIQDH
jgi:hypothetical protein